MILYPAIDILAGRCVRLYKGDYGKETVYAEDPSKKAREFAKAGCKWLHVVDLDGAAHGKTINREAVTNIIKAIPGVPVQLGGGIRNLETITGWLNAGVARVILGTMALRNPIIVKEVCQLFPGRIAVGIDARNGCVAVEGWFETSQVRALDMAKKLEDAGVAVIIYTDIDKDGTLEGPNLQETVELAESVRIPIILSGGIGSMEHLERVKAEADGKIEGVIVGRAIYDGKVDVKKAQKLLASDLRMRESGI